MIALVLSLAIGTVIPALTALVAKERASAQLKTLLTVMLAALSGGLSAALSSPPQNTSQWEHVALSILLAWVSAAASDYLGWTPTGAKAAIERRTATFGIA